MMTTQDNTILTKYNSKAFYKAVTAIAIPVALQSLIQSSLSMIDQMMVARLGSSDMAAAGLGTRPFTMLFFLLLGVTGGVGIFAAQYWGNHQPEKLHLLMKIGFQFGTLVVLAIMLPSLIAAPQIMHLFTTDSHVIQSGADYMQVLSFSFMPLLLIMLYSTVLKSADIVKLPVIAGFMSVLSNTFLNYVLIFGHLGLPALGVKGAAIATVAARLIECALLIAATHTLHLPAKVSWRMMFALKRHPAIDIPYFKMTMPLLLGELIFVSSITFYAALYGRMGTHQMAAMTVLFPLEGITFGLFSGLSTAAGVLLGQHLGAGRLQLAKEYGSRILRLGCVFTILLSLLFAAFLPFYLQWFHLNPVVHQTARILIITALMFFPIRVVNMIIGDGILRSGGQTKFLMLMTFFTLWGIGVPLGIYSAFILKWSLYKVFIAVSSEELLRMFIGLYRIRSNKWLVQLTEPTPTSSSI